LLNRSTSRSSKRAQQRATDIMRKNTLPRLAAILGVILLGPALRHAGAGVEESAQAPAGPAAQPAPAASPSPSPAPPRPPFVAGHRNGFTLQSETGDFVLKLTGYAQADGRFAAADGANSVVDSFLLRRVRPIVQGTVAKHFDFYFNPDFGGGTAALQDAYLDVRFSPKLRFRPGKMKSPFGIERLQSGQNLLFVERALPNNLVPNRDVGLQVHGELSQARIGYQLALLDGAPDGGSVDTDTNDSKDLAGRLFFQPWRTSGASPLRGLGFGVSATRGTANGALRGYTSVSQVNIFSYASTVSASGDRVRWSPQGFFYLGPVGILAEYVEARHEVQNVVTGRPTNTAELTHSAWSVTGSYLVTGEDASYGAVTPKDFFVPSAGKWGALQLVARVNRLDIDADTFSRGFADVTRSVRRATAWGVGVNWIWNGSLKYVLDYEQTRFEGGAPVSAGGDRPTEKSIETRLQLSF
jgi:phosphate-selective porin OprO/OprP